MGENPKSKRKEDLLVRLHFWITFGLTVLLLAPFDFGLDRHSGLLIVLCAVLFIFSLPYFFFLWILWMTLYSSPMWLDTSWASTALLWVVVVVAIWVNSTIAVKEVPKAVMQGVNLCKRVFLMFKRVRR